MSIVLIFLTWLFALASSLALLGSTLVELERPSFRTFRSWGVRIVSFADRIILRPVLATGGVSTTAWTIETRAKACRMLGFAALGIALLFGELASRSSP